MFTVPVRAALSLGRTSVGVAVIAMAAAAPLAAQTTVSVTGRVTAQGKPIADAQFTMQRTSGDERHRVAQVGVRYDF